MATVKRIQFWVTVGLLTAAVGAGAILYLERYETQAQAEKTREVIEAQGRAFTEHVTSESSRMMRIETKTEAAHEDFHYLRDQVHELAKATPGATVIPVPKHPAPGRE